MYEMSCGELGELIHGYLDAEFDLTRSLEIERHLNNCPACAQAYAEHLSLRRAIAGNTLYFEAPKSLKSRVRSAVRQAGRAEAGPRRLVWRWKFLWIPLGAAATALFVFFTFLSRPATETQIAQEAVSAHLRSLLPGHLVDVLSSDQHTVKPWFNGKLDFSPPVRDLAAQGFPLVGGRLDYVGNRPVAAVVYQRRKHLINLFIWPSTHPAGTGEKSLVENGYNLIPWNQSGMSCWAVSDLNVTELWQFVEQVRR